MPHPADPKAAVRGQWHPSGGWQCDCRPAEASPWTNLHKASKSYCPRCQIYRPLKRANAAQADQTR